MTGKTTEGLAWGRAKKTEGVLPYSNKNNNVILQNIWVFCPVEGGFLFFPI
ncbi:MAG: hypothetical protein HC896_05025 [Bacteroidales bacterium]|nr:hypothetical protein [Bacteroidales bacterium]